MHWWIDFFKVVSVISILPMQLTEQLLQMMQLEGHLNASISYHM